MTTELSGTGKVSVRDNEHLKFIDGLRAACALFVTAYHAHLAVYVNEAPSDAVRTLSYPFLFGHFAVAIFIVISGFSLMLPIVRGSGTLKGGASTFFRNRARRILPPYYLAMAAFVLGYLVVERETIQPADIVAHVLLLHNLFPEMIRSKVINPSFWSIAVEAQIYIFFPMLVSLWAKYDSLVITAVVSVISYVLFALLYSTSLQGITPHFYALFVLGMLGATVAYSPAERWLAVRDRFPARLLTLLLFGLIATLGQIWGPGTDVAYQKGILEGVVGLFAVSILIDLSHANRTNLRRALSWRPLVFIGSFSYSLYLLHQPLLNVVLRGAKLLYTGNDSRFLFVLFAGIPIVVAVAYGFFLFGERPFMRKAKPPRLGEVAAAPPTSR